MSNVVYIIDPAASGIEPARTLAELWQQVQPLLEKGTPSPKYVRFAKGLESAVRERLGSSLKAVRQDLGFPVRQAQVLSAAGWAYELPDEVDGHLDEGRILHSVVLQAMEHDLLVLADHLGVAFLPGRELIVESDEDMDWALLFEEELDDEEPEIMTREAMVERVLAMVTSKLQPHGFELSTLPYLNERGRPNRDFHWFVKECPGGPQFVEIIFGSLRYEGLTLIFNAGGRNREVHNVLRRIRGYGKDALRNEHYILDYTIDVSKTGEYRKWMASEVYKRVWPSNWMASEFPVQPGKGPFLEAEVSELLDVLVRASARVFGFLQDLQGIQRSLLHGRGSVVEKEVAFHGMLELAVVTALLLQDAALDDYLDDLWTYMKSTGKEPFIGDGLKMVEFLKANVSILDRG
jgi:hypothetical protein